MTNKEKYYLVKVSQNRDPGGSISKKIKPNWPKEKPKPPARGSYKWREQSDEARRLSIARDDASGTGYFPSNLDTIELAKKYGWTNPRIVGGGSSQPMTLAQGGWNTVDEDRGVNLHGKSVLPINPIKGEIPARPYTSPITSVNIFDLKKYDPKRRKPKTAPKLDPSIKPIRPNWPKVSPKK
jgi:hypothetical protein